MKWVLPKAALLALLATGAHAQNIAGDWLATLRLGGAEVRLVLHITKGGGGRLEANIDGIDQGLQKMPATGVVFKDAQLSFAVNSVSASYTGKVNAAGTAIDGTWSQGLPLPLSFRRVAVAPKLVHKPAKASDIDGTWQGRLEAEGGAQLVFHFVNTQDGLMATVDSPSQKLIGWPIPVVKRQGRSLRLEVKQVGAVYEGKINPDLASIEGTWGSPGGKTWRLVLKPVKNPQ